MYTEEVVVKIIEHLQPWLDGPVDHEEYFAALDNIADLLEDWKYD